MQAEYVGGSRQFVRWTNRVFSFDGPSQQSRQFTLTVTKYIITDRDWRRGRYTNPRWNRALPQRGEKNAVVARFEDLGKQVQDDSEHVSAFESKLPRYHRHLTNARARKSRKRKVVEELKAPTSSSSSSSSSSDSSEES